MAENSKYYTPEIEEFHVGFEFEMKERFSDGTVKTQEEFDNSKWEKQICTAGIVYIERALKGRNAEKGICGIKVKYLDKEDIESFGFKPVKQGDPYSHKAQILSLIQEEEGFNTGRKLTITCYPSNPLLTLTVENYGSYGSETYTIQLLIKNKSELKRLLKQLKVVIW